MAIKAENCFWEAAGVVKVSSSSVRIDYTVLTSKPTGDNSKLLGDN